MENTEIQRCAWTISYKSRLILALALWFLLNNSVIAESSLKIKILQLNQLSMELLNVDIYTATLLVQLEGTPLFIPLAMIEESGELRAWKALEREGYVELSVIEGLPGFSDTNEEEFLWVIRTDAGNELRDRFVDAKKYNQPNEWNLPYCGFLELVNFENGLCHF